MKYAQRALAAILSGVALALCLTGCFGQKYSVDYDGKKDQFRGAKDSYRAGATVTLYFMPGTDTDYYFYLDNEELSREYDEQKGFRLTFTMPEHDVKLSVRAVNSSVAPEPVFSKQATLSFHSFDGGGPEYTVIPEDATIFSYTSERNYGKADHENIDGAGYDVIFTFTGLKAGSTAFTISEYSPIMGEVVDEIVYGVTVNDSLEISLEERG